MTTTSLHTDNLIVLTEETVGSVRASCGRMGLCDDAAGAVLIHALALIIADGAGEPVPPVEREAVIIAATEGLAATFALALRARLNTQGRRA